MMKALLCRKSSTQLIDTLNEMSKHDEHKTFLTDYQSEKKKSAIHVALIHNASVDTACLLSALASNIGESSEEVFVRSGFFFDTVSDSNVINGNAKNVLDCADAIICCEKAASPDRLPLNAFQAVYQDDSYREKLLLAVIGFDDLFNGCANPGEEYLEYRCDIEDVLDERGVRGFSDSLFVLPELSHHFRSLADTLDQSPLIRQKCQAQAEVIIVYIRKTLEAIRKSRSDVQLEQEQLDKARIELIIQAEALRTRKSLDKARKAALSKLDRRFASGKLKVREIISRTEADTSSAITEILNDYSSTQDKAWKIPGSNLDESSFGLHLGASISEDELKKRRIHTRLNTGAMKDGMQGGAKVVDIVGNAAQPVKVGKKFVLSKFRFVDQMSKVGGSETALYKSASKVLGKYAGPVSEKLGSVAVSVQKVTRGKMFGTALEGIGGLFILANLPAEFRNDDLNRQKKEELRLRITGLINEHFHAVQAFISENAKARIHDLQSSYSFGNRDAECVILEKMLHEISQTLAAL